jgi:hypothetical protein
MDIVLRKKRNLFTSLRDRKIYGNLTRQRRKEREAELSESKTVLERCG